WRSWEHPRGDPRLAGESRRIDSRALAVHGELNRSRRRAPDPVPPRGFILHRVRGGREGLNRVREVVTTPRIDTRKSFVHAIAVALIDRKRHRSGRRTILRRDAKPLHPRDLSHASEVERMCANLLEGRADRRVVASVDRGSDTRSAAPKGSCAE